MAEAARASCAGYRRNWQNFPNQNFPVRLDGNGTDRQVARARSGGKAGVETAVRINAGKAATLGTARHSEIPADEDLPVWLQGNFENDAVRARGQKSRVHKDAVRAQAGDVLPGKIIHRRKITADYNLSVRLHDNSIDNRAC